MTINRSNSTSSDITTIAATETAIDSDPVPPTDLPNDSNALSIPTIQQESHEIIIEYRKQVTCRYSSVLQQNTVGEQVNSILIDIIPSIHGEIGWIVNSDVLNDEKMSDIERETYARKLIEIFDNGMNDGSNIDSNTLSQIEKEINNENQQNEILGFDKQKDENGEGGNVLSQINSRIDTLRSHEKEALMNNCNEVGGYILCTKIIGSNIVVSLS